MRALLSWAGPRVVKHSEALRGNAKRGNALHGAAIQSKVKTMKRLVISADIGMIEALSAVRKLESDPKAAEYVVRQAAHAAVRDFFAWHRPFLMEVDGNRVIEWVHVDDINNTCGHPTAAIMHDDEGTSYCEMCEKETRKR